MTGPPIPYDELLAAHRDAIDQRDLARCIAVTLEQELSHTQAQLADVRTQLRHALSAVGGAA